MAMIDRNFTFATNGTVTANDLHNLIDSATIYQDLITGQQPITSVGTNYELLIADGTNANAAPNAVTVYDLFEDALTAGTYTNANISEALTYGTATGTKLVSTDATITTGTITTGVIPTLTSSTATFGTTTSTAATITSGTITNLASTTGTIATLNSTTGTITTGVIPTLTSTTLITTGTGTAAAPAIVPTGDTNTGIFFPTADTIAFSEGGAEAMRIDSSGNVGIGMTSPNASVKLHVASANIASLQTQANVMFTTTDPQGANIGSYLGLGGSVTTATPTANMRLFGAIRGAKENSVDADTSGYLSLLTMPVSSVVPVERLRIDAAGTLTSQPTYDNTAAGSTVIVTSAGLIRRTSSSLKYKKDIENLDSSIVDNAIDKLRPVWYRTKNPEGDDKSTWSHVGLIAEEVDSVEPRLVRYKTVEVSTNENGERIQTQLENPIPEDVDYAKLSVILLSELKNQKERISLLESRILSLESA